MMKGLFKIFFWAWLGFVVISPAKAASFDVLSHGIGKSNLSEVREDFKSSFPGHNSVMEGGDLVAKRVRIDGGLYDIRAKFDGQNHELSSITLNGKPSKNGFFPKQGFARKAGSDEVYETDSLRATVTHHAGRITVVYEKIPEETDSGLWGLSIIVAFIAFVAFAFFTLRYFVLWIIGSAAGYIFMHDAGMGFVFGVLSVIPYVILKALFDNINWPFRRRSGPVKIRMTAEQFRGFQEHMRERVSASRYQGGTFGGQRAFEGGSTDSAEFRINPATGLPMVGAVDTEGNFEGQTQINPANGLPMIGGHSGVDVHGNTYGTSTHDVHAPAQSFESGFHDPNGF